MSERVDDRNARQAAPELGTGSHTEPAPAGRVEHIDRDPAAAGMSQPPEEAGVGGSARSDAGAPAAAMSSSSHPATAGAPRADNQSVMPDPCAQNNGGCDTLPIARCKVMSGAVTCSCPSGTFGEGVGADGCMNRFELSLETVIDKLLRVTWQRRVPMTYAPICVGNACLYAEAQMYCESLTLSGAAWRLPTKAELASLVDATRSSPPVIDLGAFPETPPELFWTSSPVDAGSSVSVISFSNGGTFSSSTTSQTSSALVRCVH